jgi:hypothetical protein
MRDYRHTLMGQEHGPSLLTQDRSTPQRAQLWRHYKGGLYEIVALAHYEWAPEVTGVVYRRYEPNGQTWVRDLVNFMAEIEPGKYRFTREY